MPSLSLPVLFAFALVSTAVPASAAPDLVKWRSIAAGEKEASSSGKPILYFLTAEWCGPCHMMKRAVFQDQQAADFINKEYIPVEVMDQMAEAGRNPPDVQRVQVRFQLRGYPTLVVARPGTGEAVTTPPGWNNKEDTVRFLKSARQQIELAEKSRKKAAR